MEDAMSQTATVRVGTAGQVRRARSLRRGRVRALLVVDLMVIWAAFIVAYLIAQQIGPPAMILPTAPAVAVGVVITLTWPVIFTAYGLYERQSRAVAPRSMDEVAPLFHALLTGSLLLLLIAQGVQKATSWFVMSPLEAATFIGFALVGIPLARAALRTWVLPRFVQPRRALLVGAGSAADSVRRKLEAHPEFGMQVVRTVDDTTDLVGLLDDLDADWVILAQGHAPSEETLDLVRAVRRPDVHLSIVPTYFELFASNADIEDLEGMAMVSLPPMRLSRTTRTLKRGFDLLAAVAGLLLLAPLLAACAVAIKLDSRGAIFFRQARHGRAGRVFHIVKFRTMVDGAEAARLAMGELNEMDGAGPLFKMKADPRITRVGAFLRKWSLDELPQLLNVVRGEMSLVGPRPFVVHESEQITGWAGRRLDTTPGITGLWQVLGRNDVPFEEMVKLDYMYVTNWSLWWDVKILFRTVPTVVSRKGAY
jgi:exopolysaccharide biosynthesis polyprenyl glycosylphosphotransferase